MTSPSSPRINAGDRVAPKRAPAPKPAPRGRWIVPSAIAAGVVCLACAGLGAFYLMPGKVEVAKQRISAIKLGPLPDMPDLRDGVPALMTKAVPAVSQAPRLASAETTSVQVPPDAVEDANRKAMASTIASTTLRPGLATAPTAPPTATPPVAQAPVGTPREAAPTSPVVVVNAQPVRQVEIKPVRGATSVGGAPAAAAAVHLQAPPPVASTAGTVPPSTVASGQGEGVTPSADTAPPLARSETSAPSQAAAIPPAELATEPAPPRAASLPPAAPLPPRRPSFASAEPVDRAAAPRTAPRTPTPPRVAAATRAPAAAGPQTPAAAPAEERSLLGIPVPGFIPSGRDIRDAASSITDAVTSLPSRF